MTELKSTSELLARLRQILGRQRLVLFSAGFLAAGATVVAFWISLSLVATVMILPVWLKVALLTGSSLLSIYLFARFALSRLFQGDVEAVARSVEKRHPDLKGRLIAAIQFSRMKKTLGYSTELIVWTERQALEKSSRINFNEVVTFHSVLKSGRYLIVSALAALLLLAALPGLFAYSYEVYSHPTTEIAPPLGYQVVSYPTSTEWIKYRDIEIGAAITGGQFPAAAAIYYRLAGGSWQKTDFDLKTLKHGATTQGDSVNVSVKLRQINKSFDFYVEAGRVKTEIRRIDVVDRPRVNGIKLSIFYPDYTGLGPTVINENNGSFSAVVGSRVNMKIETNLPVVSAQLAFPDSSRTPMKISDRTAETALAVDSSRSYHIELVDHLGERNPDPIEYYITAVPDEYPSIDVLRPGFDVNLGDDMVLPLMARIFDDFGFSSLVLKFVVNSQGRPSDENVAVLHFSDRIKTEGDVSFNWDMDRLGLFPGDYVIYYFEVADNDRISGPKITKSRQFVARLPSLEEIVAQTEAEGAERITKTEDILKRGKDLVERVKQAARKLSSEEKTANQADWQQQKELEAIADKNQQMVDDIRKMAEKMDSSLERMSENALLSREIMEKLAQIQKLYEEVATPEMKDAQKRLMEALQKLDRNELTEAMKNLQMSQEELLKRLERTLALLKHLQLQQKMEAMMRQVEELTKRQEKTNRDTDSTAQAKLPDLAKDETKTKDDLENVKKAASELSRMLKESDMAQSKEAQEFVGSIEKTDAQEDMAMMSQSLQQRQRSDASRQGKQALSKLMEMLDNMQKQMQAMKGGEQDEIEKKMRMAIEDANYLSKDQETLLKKAAELDPRSAMLQELATSQLDMVSACNGLKKRIEELGKASPFVAAEIQTLVRDATVNMDAAIQAFDGRSGNQAQTNQREAMTDLNRVSLRLMESLNQQKQCNGGGNCSNPMKKLQSLCDKQNSLNQQTQGQCNNPGSGKMGESGDQGREALKRLAAEQGALSKGVEELQREFGDSRQILGRLDDIAKEMKKAEESLDKGDVGPETTERQLRIYSRMLEATRSLQRKDFSEQRKAKSATTEAVHLPPALTNDILNDRVKLEDRLRQYLGDNYPTQYEEQIKAYFKALLQQESLQENQNLTKPAGE